MISYYLTTVPTREGWVQFELSESGQFFVLAIANLKFDNGTWFHKNLLLSCDLQPAGRSPIRVFYHPNAENLGYLLDISVHAAVDFAVFVGSIGGIFARGRGAALVQNPTRLERASVAVKNTYQVGSGVKAGDEGVELLWDHIKNLTHPSVFSEEGYYDENKKLRYSGKIYKKDIYNDDFPPKTGRGNKMV